MFSLIIKKYVTAAINRYKIRRYVNCFQAPLTASEKSLLLPFLHFLVKPEIKVIYDIGAASGEFATALAKQRNIHKVYAFEPLPSSWLSLSMSARRDSKISCFNTALGENLGKAKFFVTADGDSSSCLRPNTHQGKAFPTRGLTTEIEVPIARLDDLVATNKLQRPDVMILDVQGFEIQVLQGATDCLSSARYCILECCFVPLYEGAPLIGDIWEYMKRRGWKVVGVGPQHCDNDGQPIFIDLVFERVVS